MLGLGGSQIAFANELWQRPVYGTIIQQLVVRVVTGTDDLRQGSKAYAYIGLENAIGKRETLYLSGLNLNEQTGSWDGWPGGSFRLKKCWAWADSTIFPEIRGNNPAGFPVNYIRWFWIHFESGKPDIFSSPDTWNLNAIRVLYPKSPTLNPIPTTTIDWSQYYELFYAAGPDGSSGTSSRYLKSFTNIDNWETFNPFPILP
jgi:hypothetical protein